MRDGILKNSSPVELPIVKSMIFTRRQEKPAQSEEKSQGQAAADLCYFVAYLLKEMISEPVCMD